MLDAATHLAQARHNEDFFGRIDQSLDSDWAVTALFYAALHYVDAYLFRKNLNPGDHAERNRMMQANPTTSAIWSHYRRLLDRSWDARYNAATYTPPQIAQLHQIDFARVKREMTS